MDNLEELLAQAKAMEPALSSRSKPSSFKRLESILPHINDFAGITAVHSGADAKATGIVWGSFKVVFMVAPALIQASICSRANGDYAASISLERHSGRYYQYS